MQTHTTVREEKKKKIGVYFPGSFWFADWIFSVCNIWLIRKLRNEFDEIKVVRLRQLYFREFLVQLILGEKPKHTIKSQLDRYCQWLEKEAEEHEITLIAYSSGGLYARYVYEKCPNAIQAFIAFSCIFDTTSLRSSRITSWFVDFLVDPHLIDDDFGQRRDRSRRPPVLAYYGRCECLGPLRSILFDATYEAFRSRHTQNVKSTKRRGQGTKGSAGKVGHHRFQCINLGSGGWLDYLTTNHWLLYILSFPPRFLLPSL